MEEVKGDYPFEGKKKQKLRGKKRRNLLIWNGNSKGSIPCTQRFRSRGGGEDSKSFSSPSKGKEGADPRKTSDGRNILEMPGAAQCWGLHKETSILCSSGGGGGGAGRSEGKGRNPRRIKRKIPPTLRKNREKAELNIHISCKTAKCLRKKG